MFFLFLDSNKCISKIRLRNSCPSNKCCSCKVVYFNHFICDKDALFCCKPPPPLNKISNAKSLLNLSALLICFNYLCCVMFPYNTLVAFPRPPLVTKAKLAFSLMQQSFCTLLETRRVAPHCADHWVEPLLSTFASITVHSGLRYNTFIRF